VLSPCDTITLIDLAHNVGGDLQRPRTVPHIHKCQARPAGDAGVRRQQRVPTADASCNAGLEAVSCLVWQGTYRVCAMARRVGAVRNALVQHEFAVRWHKSVEHHALGRIREEAEPEVEAGVSSADNLPLPTERRELIQRRRDCIDGGQVAHLRGPALISREESESTHHSILAPSERHC
jgi:hypothetical protein